MNIEDQFSLDHLIFTERKCRSCGATKDLLTDFYRTRRNRNTVSAYSYECKDCTKTRVSRSRKENKNKLDISYNPIPRFGPDIYPDW
jgi:hypothetical protein